MLAGAPERHSYAPRECSCSSLAPSPAVKQVMRCSFVDQVMRRGLSQVLVEHVPQVMRRLCQVMRRLFVPQSDQVMRRLFAPQRGVPSDHCASQRKGTCYNLIAVSMYDEYSIGISTRPICTRCCFTMTQMILVCRKFH